MPRAELATETLKSLATVGRFFAFGGLADGLGFGVPADAAALAALSFDHVTFHPIPFYSIPFHFIPFHFIPFHSIPFHAMP